MSWFGRGEKISAYTGAEADADVYNGATTSYPVRCPICGHTDTASFVREISRGYSQWYCEPCDLEFAWPMQPGDRDFYQSVWSYAPQQYTSASKHPRTIARIWEYVAVLEYEPASHRQLLDIGCGPGEFLYLARECYNYDVTGIDFNEDAVHAAREVYNLRGVVRGSWPDDAGSIRVGTFDRVTMFHIVEHVGDPIDALRSAALALKPGGLLGVAVPVARNRPQLRKVVRDLPPHHLTLWSERALCRAFESAGLESVWVARRPLLANDFLVWSQDKFPLLRHPMISRFLWVVVRRLLVLPVILARALFPATGCVVAGMARIPASAGINSDEHRH